MLGTKFRPSSSRALTQLPCTLARTNAHTWHTHLQRQLEIYNKRDVEEFMTLFSDDCQLVDLQTVRTVALGILTFRNRSRPCRALTIPFFLPIRGTSWLGARRVSRRGTPNASLRVKSNASSTREWQSEGKHSLRQVR